MAGLAGGGVSLQLVNVCVLSALVCRDCTGPPILAECGW